MTANERQKEQVWRHLKKAEDFLNGAEATLHPERKKRPSIVDKYRKRSERKGESGDASR